MSLNKKLFPLINHELQVIETGKLSKHQQGFSLIEVMISVVILSVGLLGLTNLQTRSINNATVAYVDTQSMFFLQKMVERLRIDKAAAANGDYNIALSTFSELTAGDGSEPLAEKERYKWFNNLNNTIPGAKASISCDSETLCVVEVLHDVSGSIQKQKLATYL